MMEIVVESIGLIFKGTIIVFAIIGLSRLFLATIEQIIQEDWWERYEKFTSIIFVFFLLLVVLVIFVTDSDFLLPPGEDDISDLLFIRISRVLSIIIGSILAYVDHKNIKSKVCKENSKFVEDNLYLSGIRVIHNVLVSSQQITELLKIDKMHYDELLYEYIKFSGKNTTFYIVIDHNMNHQKFDSIFELITDNQIIGYQVMLKFSSYNGVIGLDNEDIDTMNSAWEIKYSIED